jgi:hypothetical protein
LLPSTWRKHSSVTSARNQQTAWHHIPEDYIFIIKHVRGLLKRNKNCCVILKNYETILPAGPHTGKGSGNTGMSCNFKTNKWKTVIAQLKG